MREFLPLIFAIGVRSAQFDRGVGGVGWSVDDGGVRRVAVLVLEVVDEDGPEGGFEDVFGGEGVGCGAAEGD